MSNYKQIKKDRIKDYITNLPSVANKKKADGASIKTPTTSTTIQAADSEAPKTSENEKLKGNKNSTSIKKNKSADSLRVKSGEVSTTTVVDPSKRPKSPKNRKKRKSRNLTSERHADKPTVSTLKLRRLLQRQMQ